VRKIYDNIQTRTYKPKAQLCYEVMNDELEKLWKEAVVAYFISLIRSFARLRDLPNSKQEFLTASFSPHSNLYYVTL
jgi:hypothetical protein